MVEQKIALIQVYIHAMKGVEVDISVTSSRDYFLLEHAYAIASLWAQANNIILHRA